MRQLPASQNIFDYENSDLCTARGYFFIGERFYPVCISIQTSEEAEEKSEVRTKKHARDCDSFLLALTYYDTMTIWPQPPPRLLLSALLKQKHLGFENDERNLHSL